MKSDITDFRFALSQARKAFSKKRIQEARYWAHLAVELSPDREETWLFLAAVASPRASLFYLKQALEINPRSQRARKGIHWANQRLRKTPQHLSKPTYIPASIPSTNFIRYRKAPIWLNIILVCLIIAVILVSGNWLVTKSLGMVDTHQQPVNIIAGINLSKATRTPTFTPTFTPSPTPTNTPTPTPTYTPTITPTPTDTPLPTLTNTPEPPKPVSNYPGLPSGVSLSDRWIDIDLSQQRTYAYEGDSLVNSFVVSTGTWQHPTVTGEYKVYVKYRYADMSGPGYYLPSVPYVMYFYKGYGLHGTYWHNNFGTPMSHGCVNLRTDDAGWLFDWSYVGIVVNVHY